MFETICHGLPLLAAGQAQKEVTHNEAISAVDRLLHIAVQSRQLGAPPSGVVTGQAWIVGNDPVGDWAGRAGAIAHFDGFGWIFTAPRTGTMAWIVDEGAMSVWNGSWSQGWPVKALLRDSGPMLAQPPVAVSLPSGGAVVDAECRAAYAALVAALRALGLVT